MLIWCTVTRLVDNSCSHLKLNLFCTSTFVKQKAWPFLRVLDGCVEEVGATTSATTSSSPASSPLGRSRGSRASASVCYLPGCPSPASRRPTERSLSTSGQSGSRSPPLGSNQAPGASSDWRRQISCLLWQNNSQALFFCYFFFASTEYAYCYEFIYYIETQCAFIQICSAFQ